MFNELTNLLPLERQRALSRDYLLRIGVIIAVLTTALTLSAAVLLIPTYVLLAESANAKNMQLTKTTATLSSAEELALSARLAALSNNAAALVALSNTPSVSATVRAVLATTRPGITLSGFSYAPSSGSGKDSGTIGLSGVSATRDALRSYQLALQGAPFALSAVLPVSAYAKDANIAFTITVTLSP
ncbi:MAG: hypothetical protein Q7R59_01985 [bacterium]|nr:hypothetical protein [bacterium]